MAASRILIVEDEPKLLDLLSETFRSEGFSVFTCVAYHELENFLSLPINGFDIIILDRMLQTHDAGFLIPKIKFAFPDSRVMVLSAINTPSEKASMLHIGADDYLAKPFSSEELIARVHALLRRRPVEISLGNLSLNIEKRTVLIMGRELPLTNKEFLVLKILAQTPGKIFSKSFLSQHVWEMSPEAESNVVEATINKLRRHLEELGATVQVKNARNVGYWIEE